MRVGVLVGCACLAGCGGGNATVDAAPDVAIDAMIDDGRVEIASIHATVNRDLDVLWVIDDTAGTLGMQTSLKNDFPNFINVLNAMEGGLPNVHIGVISPDLGTKGSADPSPGPATGSGPGSCSGNGKFGNLQTNGTPALNGAAFISDIKNVDGTRNKDYTGDLSSAFAAMASRGNGGCSFVQPIEAAARALMNNPANAGFRRPAASFALLFVTNQDDCSFAHSTLLDISNTALGPLQPFRCTRFGVTCSSGGATPDDMNVVGSKAGCASNNASAYFAPLPDYTSFFSGLASNVFVGTLAGPTTPVDVELRTPPGGGSLTPALAHSCSWVDQSTQTSVADPPVRLVQFAKSMAHHAVTEGCAQDVSQPLTDFALGIRSLIGDSCVVYSIAMLKDCVATETTGGATTTVPACDTTMTKPCWSIVSDPAMCLAGIHNRLVVQRTVAPMPDSVVTLRCAPP